MGAAASADICLLEISVYISEVAALRLVRGAPPGGPRGAAEDRGAPNNKAAGRITPRAVVAAAAAVGAAAAAAAVATPSLCRCCRKQLLLLLKRAVRTVESGLEIAPLPEYPLLLRLLLQLLLLRAEEGIISTSC